MKKAVSFLLLITLLCTVGVGCVSCRQKPAEATLNGAPLSDYTIVYGAEALDYNYRAALYLRDQIEKRTGATLPVITDAEEAREREIVVGETGREISQALDVSQPGFTFATLAKEGSVAMEAEAFVIAAAAYYFIETYVPEEAINAQVPEEITLGAPIPQAPKHYIFLIGDGMGEYHTRLFRNMSATKKTTYSDGEELFYGEYFPHHGVARTLSLSGITDSAAGGTALATGYKTANYYVGRNKDLEDVPSLTEIAASLGMATAVMSTEPQTGATPASFSAHANDRNDSEAILASQAQLQEQYGTIISCDYDVYDAEGVARLEEAIVSTLDTLGQNEKGFFIMYEEAHIDKHSHSNSLDGTFSAVVRFNQAIGRFMEFAFYHPDTFVLITADHETGLLLPDTNGRLAFHAADHSALYVPVYVYGEGSGLFEGRILENIQIPKTIASFWGVEIEGSSNRSYPALTKE